MKHKNHTIKVKESLKRKIKTMRLGNKYYLNVQNHEEKYFK